MHHDAHRYRFGPFEFDPRTGELEREGSVDRLAPQPALVLTALLDAAGELVTRDALQELLWPDTIVEFDKGLNFCVREVRAALGDEAASPSYVETLPRRGYRFIAPVEAVKPDRAPAARLTTLLGTPVRRATAAGLLAAAAGGLVIADAGGSATPEPEPPARAAAEMGGYLLHRAKGDDVERSVEFFRRAIALDPDYARAHAGLGAAYLFLDRAEEGKRALARSVELDPDRWAPHLTLALHTLRVAYDRAGARPHFRRALALAPEEVVVRHTHAWYRAVTGDLPGAIEEMATALELDPVSPRVNGDVGRLFYLAGRHDEAIVHCRRTGELEPETLRHRDCVIHALLEKGAPDRAREEALAAMEALSGPPEERDTAGLPSSDGLDGYWRWAARTIAELADAGAESHVHAAAAWARAGETDRAFDALDAAYRVRCPVLLQAPLDPAFRPLHGDPRWADLMVRTGASAARGGPSP